MIDKYEIMQYEKCTVKKNFITGLIALFPIALTVLIFWFVVTKVGGIVDELFKKIPYLREMPSFLLSFLGFIGIVLIIYLIGAITRSYIGRKAFDIGENIITKVPVIKAIYTSGRKFTDALFVEKAGFKKAVIVEFPRQGMHTLGFLTNESGWEIAGKESVNVFVPTVPNITSGFYLLIPRSEIIETTLTIDDALKTIISAGVIVPDKRKY